jgi:hypothetical protein
MLRLPFWRVISEFETCLLASRKSYLTDAAHSGGAAAQPLPATRSPLSHFLSRGARKQAGDMSATAPVVKEIPEEIQIAEAKCIVEDLKKNAKDSGDSLKACQRA